MVYGQSTVLTAQTVPVPTGVLQFRLGGENAGPPVALDARGEASFDPSYLLDVGDVVSATYGGDARWGWSTGVAPVEVVPARTATRLRIEPNPVPPNGNVMLDVDVANLDTDIAPFGSVRFSIDGQQVGPPFDLDENGRLVLTVELSRVEPGDHRVSVDYADDTGTPEDGEPSAASTSVRVTTPPPPAATPTARPTTPAPAPAPRAVTSQQLRKLSARVAATLRRRGLAALRRAGPPFAAATSGTLRLTVSTGRMQLASGRVRFQTTGTHRVAWRLSAAGRKIIDRGRAVRVEIRTTFVSAQGTRLAVTTKARARG